METKQVCANGLKEEVDVSIIVVASSVKDLLRDCLQSVFDQTQGIVFEVIYVDNASVDRSVEMVARWFPQVRIIRNSTNKGFTKANNQGIPLSVGRYILLLNSDTVVLDNAIAKLVVFADLHSSSAVVGPRVLNPDRSLQRSCFMFPSVLNLVLSATYMYKIFPRSRFFGRERMTWWDFSDEREVETVCGCCSLVRKKAIDQVGLMDDRYFFYGDDPDWCFRFKEVGWKVMFMPYGEIIHYGGMSTSQMARLFRLQLCGSQLIFMKLHRPWISFVIARFLHAAFFMVRVPFWVIMALVLGRRRKKFFERAATYLIGSLYCLTDWKSLLVNQEIVRKKFSLNE